MKFGLPSRKAFLLSVGFGVSALDVSAMAVSVLVAGPSFAQETVSPEHLAAAKRAILATKATQRLDNILPTIATSIKGQLILSRPDLEGPLSDIVDSATIELAGRRGDLENEIARIYTTIFTTEDLNGIADFYESEAGLKLVRDAPLLARQVDKASKTWTAGVNRDVRLAVDKKMVESGYKK